MPAGLGDPLERVEFARSGSVRFTADVGGTRQPVLLDSVAPRLVSEVLRDIDLFTSVPDPMRSPTLSSAAEASPLLASRADALRRAIPSLPFARSVSVVGLWLRVQSGGEAWAISIGGGPTLRLPRGSLVSVPLEEPLPDIGYLPVDEDETLRRIVATAAKLLGPG